MHWARVQKSKISSEFMRQENVYAIHSPTADGDAYYDVIMCYFFEGRRAESQVGSFP
jgi:hypothetical protein